MPHKNLCGHPTISMHVNRQTTWHEVTKNCSKDPRMLCFVCVDLSLYLRSCGDYEVRMPAGKEEGRERCHTSPFPMARSCFEPSTPLSQISPLVQLHKAKKGKDCPGRGRGRGGGVSLDLIVEIIVKTHLLIVQRIKKSSQKRSRELNTYDSTRIGSSRNQKHPNQTQAIVQCNIHLAFMIQRLCLSVGHICARSTRRSQR